MAQTASRTLRWVLLVFTLLAGLLPALAHAGLAAAPTVRPACSYDLTARTVATSPKLADPSRRRLDIEVGSIPAAVRADPCPSNLVIAAEATPRNLDIGGGSFPGQAPGSM